MNLPPSGPTASLVLLSQLQPLSRSASSTLTLYVPLVLRDGTSGLTSTGTVTVSICPCLRGGARAGEKEKDKQAEGEWDWEREAVCLPQQSTLPSPGLSTAALLAILACVATLLGKYSLNFCPLKVPYCNTSQIFIFSCWTQVEQPCLYNYPKLDSRLSLIQEQYR